MNQLSPFSLLIFLSGLLILPNTVQAQYEEEATYYPYPLVEMRGVWIASVANIDWPSQPGLTSEEQQQEFDNLLDDLQKMGMNAVFVQVRPAGDALYNSKLAPWSKYLTGQQGEAPDPYYDPMEYMIKAAHSRQMEFHAWLNPYRASFDLDTASLSPQHPLRRLPDDLKAEWFYQYGNRFYFNPANPMVIKYITDIVNEIVRKYDVDGIHFDDYFYPYPEKNVEPYDDYDQFALDPRGFTNLEDWRRDNIDRMIAQVSKSIKKLKPYVRFGIGPFGVWRNIEDDELGSETRAGVRCYDDNYADVRKWLEEGWIDYVAPQLYWSIGYEPADYEILLDWWTKNAFGKQVYAGHAAYKINNSKNDPNWEDPEEINRQVWMNRANRDVQGSIFFSASPLLRNPLGVADSLSQSLFPTVALIPPLPSEKDNVPVSPAICRINGTPSAVQMAWNICNVDDSAIMPYYFVLYRFDGKEAGDLMDASGVLRVTPFGSDRWIYEDKETEEGQFYTYVLVPYSRSHVSGNPAEPVTVKKTARGIKKKRIFGWFF